jgi:hypothetical protein
MAMAWGLYRAELNGPDPRTFADALAGAWRVRKRSEVWGALPWADRSRPRHLRIRSMVQSPIRRSLGGQPYASTRAAGAGYLTSRLGA